MSIRTGLAPEITPLPVAQVQFTGLRLLPVEQHPGASEIVFIKRLLDGDHVGVVSDAASGEGRRLRGYPQSPLIVARRFGFPLRLCGLDRLPGAERNPGHKGGYDSSRSAKH